MATRHELPLDQSEREVPGDVDDCIRRAREGSSDALGRLYAQCHLYLLLIANQELDAELRAKLGPSDVVQETLLKAQRGFDHFEGATGAELRGWLRSILLNTVRDAGRRFQAGGKRDLARERELHAVLTDHADARQLTYVETPSKRLMAWEQTVALRSALARLPEDFRRVIILRNIERRAFAEIGAAMNRSDDAARKLWLRAVERLRQLLGAADESR